MSALLYLLAATFINIVLDLAFVAFLGMGVAGVALATVIAQFISAFLSLRRLTRMSEYFDMKKEYLLADRKYIGALVRLGVPSGITQAIFSMSMIVVQSLTNSFGETFIAANVIVMRIDGFVVLPAMSFGAAMTTYAGQNIGAGRLDRVREGAGKGTLTAMAISTVVTGLILVFGKPIMGLFTKTDALIDLSYRMMQIMAAGYIIIEITQCLSGIMRGAGDTIRPMWISIITSIAIRIPLAYGLVELTKTPDLPQGNCAMMYVSMLISWSLGAVISLIVYRAGRWQKAAGLVSKG